MEDADNSGAEPQPGTLVAPQHRDGTYEPTSRPPRWTGLFTRVPGIGHASREGASQDRRHNQPHAERAGDRWSGGTSELQEHGQGAVRLVDLPEAHALV